MSWTTQAAYHVYERSPPRFTYKALSNTFSCRDVTFEVGKTYEVEGDPALCVRGFHSCMVPPNVWHYYPDKFINRYALVENIGKVIKDNDGNKVVCNKIKIVEEIPPEEFENISGCFPDEYGSLSVIFGSNPTRETIAKIMDTITSNKEYAITLYMISPIICQMLPSIVTHIEFDRFFNESILSVTFPNSIKYIGFGGFFDQPLPDNLPDSITMLCMGERFNQPLPNNLPNKLEVLTFPYKLGHFNHPLRGLPDSLQKLVLSAEYNHPLPNPMPKSLTHLLLGKAFDYELPELPEGLQSLVLSKNYKHPLPKGLNASIVEYI